MQHRAEGDAADARSRVPQFDVKPAQPAAVPNIERDFGAEFVIAVEAVDQLLGRTKTHAIEGENPLPLADARRRQRASREQRHHPGAGPFDFAGDRDQLGAVSSPGRHRIDPVQLPRTRIRGNLAAVHASGQDRGAAPQSELVWLAAVGVALEGEHGVGAVGFHPVDGENDIAHPDASRIGRAIGGDIDHPHTGQHFHRQQRIAFIDRGFKAEIHQQAGIARADAELLG